MDGRPGGRTHFAFAPPLITCRNGIPVGAAARLQERLRRYEGIIRQWCLQGREERTGEDGTAPDCLDSGVIRECSASSSGNSLNTVPSFPLLR